MLGADLTAIGSDLPISYFIMNPSVSWRASTKSLDSLSQHILYTEPSTNVCDLCQIYLNNLTLYLHVLQVIHIYIIKLSMNLKPSIKYKPWKSTRFWNNVFLKIFFAHLNCYIYMYIEIKKKTTGSDLICNEQVWDKIMDQNQLLISVISLY